MNRPATHRWLPFYCLILFGIGVGGTSFSVFRALNLPGSGGFIFLGVVMIAIRSFTWWGLVTRKLWGWYLNFGALFAIPVLKTITVLMFSGKYDYSVNTAVSGSGAIAILWLIYAVPNVVYFKKRKYLFDDGAGPYKMLFGKGFRVLDPHIIPESAASDDTLYEEVSKELEAKELVSGVWTRAFAEADGDENRAKAIYIKLRVAQLAGRHQKIQIQGKCTRSGRDNWVLAVVVLAAIGGVAYWMIIQSRGGSSRRLSPACSAVEPYQQPRAVIKLAHSQSVVSRESILAGGDANAISREVVNERWVRNTYANGDVTMSDNFTGRMWFYESSAGFSNWSNAVADCGNLTYAGYSDWRLPDKDTLTAQFSQIGCFAGEQDGGYWSSTSDTNITDTAWYVYMSNGVVGSWPKTLNYYVWPVRGGQ